MRCVRRFHARRARSKERLLPGDGRHARDSSPRGAAASDGGVRVPAVVAGQRPALLLLQHLPVGHTGLENDEFTLRTAERFAENGYVVAVPFLFHWWPKSDDLQRKREQSRDDRTVLDVVAAFSLLASDPQVDARAIGRRGSLLGRARGVARGVPPAAAARRRHLLRGAVEAGPGRGQPAADRAGVADPLPNRRAQQTAAARGAAQGPWHCFGQWRFRIDVTHRPMQTCNTEVRRAGAADGLSSVLRGCFDSPVAPSNLERRAAAHARCLQTGERRGGGDSPCRSAFSARAQCST